MNTFKDAVALPFSIMIENLQDLVPEQPPALILNAKNDWNYTDDSFWSNYHDLATLNSFTEAMIKQYPDLVSRTSMGVTHEGREVFGMTIHGYKNRTHAKEQDSGEEIESNEDDQASSWWSWLFESPSATQLSKRRSKPKKHPKEILFHAGQHARGIKIPSTVSLSYVM
jgi:hypothetical protein